MICSTIAYTHLRLEMQCISSANKTISNTVMLCSWQQILKVYFTLLNKLKMHLFICTSKK